MKKEKVNKLNHLPVVEERKNERIVVYHKPNCAKSKEVYDLLRKKKAKFDIIEYLVTPPSPQELAKVLKMLGIKAEELVRKKEPLYKDNFSEKKYTEKQ